MIPLALHFDHHRTAFVEEVDPPGPALAAEIDLAAPTPSPAADITSAKRASNPEAGGIQSAGRRSRNARSATTPARPLAASSPRVDRNEAPESTPFAQAVSIARAARLGCTVANSSNAIVPAARSGAV